MDLQFDLPKEQHSIIKVIGVGGGGGNAVAHMFNEGIIGVNFVVANTDEQALETNPIPEKIQLGPEITQGLGAGSNPDVGAQATVESMESIQAALANGTRMVFVTAGMGGGTGTGGAPVIAKVAREMGILTVGIVTTPFSFEGRRKLKQADEGIQKLRDNVDTLIIISNDKIREIYGDLSWSDAFGNADNIVANAARSISEIITVAGKINVDFADVEYVMKDSGVAIMGSAAAEGEDRAIRAVQAALNSPLLNDNEIRGAKHILLNISSGATQARIDEITEINDFIQDAAGNDTDIIFGTCEDETLGDKISVTIIATGFDKRGNATATADSQKVVVNLDAPHNSGSNVRISNEAPVTNEPNRVVLDTEDDPSTRSGTPSASSGTMSETTWNLEEENDVTSNEDELLDFQLKVIDEPQVAPAKQEEELSFYTSSKGGTEEPTTPSEEEAQEELDERKRRLKDLSYKWNNSNNIAELENEPAYKRKGIELENVQHSSTKNMSDFRLEEGDYPDGVRRPEIRKNNSFLHDNVD